MGVREVVVQQVSETQRPKWTHRNHSFVLRMGGHWSDPDLLSSGTLHLSKDVCLYSLASVVAYNLVSGLP